ncbi:cupin domain-containing protein [Phormidium yuhuli AB48]|uniref:Cupin domain-containing protein n=1 Tax=Phormidium yuhuli AB48 TaxID=2940671 RepID=A0ABY5AN66_9CYAN|nr:cupin domain-containing protein [Phormidium yuhuli]USR90645.1 cupin domain-containing protein [Phormidium yuhuli AB48]
MASVKESTNHKALPTLTETTQGIAATELRPWGSFTVLEEGTRYKIKRIEVKPGHRLSLQMHHHRSEHWIVVSGTARVICDEKEELVYSNQSTYVPQGTSHRLENPGVIPLVLIEVQNGEYLGEDDIIRFQDDYARKDNG